MAAMEDDFKFQNSICGVIWNIQYVAQRKNPF
jgi:hypothetical protein